jgi:hypothetical protein
MVIIKGHSISQRHLECLTNPYLEEKDKYLGDEVCKSLNHYTNLFCNIPYQFILICLRFNIQIIDAFIDHYKLTNSIDGREDGMVFMEGALVAMALENDGKKNAKVHLRMGRSDRGVDYLTNNLVIILFPLVNYYYK